VLRLQWEQRLWLRRVNSRIALSTVYLGYPFVASEGLHAVSTGLPRTQPHLVLQRECREAAHCGQRLPAPRTMQGCLVEPTQARSESPH
jgi:hypothetical protein